MKRLSSVLLLFLCICVGLPARAQLQKSFDSHWGEPLLVLVETNPNLMVAGADVPTFALYEGGQIIFKKSSRKETRYLQTRMAKEQLQEYIGSLLISDELLQQPADTAATSSSGQPSIALYLNFDTLVVKKVYGDLRNDQQARDHTAASFIKVYDKLLAFDDSHAQDWIPDKIEVLVTDMVNSTHQSVPWPANWPTLKSPDTIWRSEKLYSLYLDKKHYKDFQRFMQKLKENQPVEINGKKFTISYRLPFPNLQ